MLAQATLAELAEVARAIGATSKRLEKARLLTAYWAHLDDEDLQRAARYLSGHMFASWDRRVLNVGASVVIKVLAHVVQADDASVVALKQRAVQLGDLGELAGQVLPVGTAGWTLQQLDAHLAAAAGCSTPTQRAKALHGLLAGCTPDEGRFVVKLVLGDLRIGLKEGAVEDALARAFAVDVQAVQWANMLLGDVGETAVRARRKALDGIAMRLFHPLKFMLASPVLNWDSDTQALPARFALEDKYDGIRAQAHCSAVATAMPTRGVVHEGVRVALFSRTLDDITGSFPDLIPALAQLAAGGAAWLLDGEIVARRDGRALPFAALQTRLGRKTPTAQVIADTPVGFMVFDALFRNGTVLLQEPQWARRAVLEQLSAATSAPSLKSALIHIAPSVVTEGTAELTAAFTAARERGNEGLMVKDVTSTYKPGRRGRDWLKIKRPQASLDVVVTAAEVGHGRRHTVLSDYTFAVRRSVDDATLVDIGKAYSGLTDAEIAQLTTLLQQETTAVLNHGKKRLVRPVVVLEVTFDLVQRSNRYASGFALRFPRILRWRDDKPVSEIDTLETVATLAL